MAHAKFAPSSAKRWLACPASIRLSEGAPEQSSSFAEEGTAAHAAAERWLLHGDAPADPKMREHLRVYVDEVNELASAKGAERHLEVRVFVNDTCYGTADCIVWAPLVSTLFVVDLKYGAGVAVEAKGNQQLKTYALAALKTMGYPAKIVEGIIVQPRCEHPAGPVRSDAWPAVDLLDHEQDILEAQAAANSLHPPVTPGDHCRWCPASPKCPAMADRAMRAASAEFLPALYVEPAKLAEALDMVPLLEERIRAVRALALSEAEAGRPAPGYKLVEKRATRKWRDEAAAAKWLESQAIDPWERKIITPAAAEKHMPKALKSEITDLVVKESSGYTLVPEDDNRRAVTPTLGFEPVKLD